MILFRHGPTRAQSHAGRFWCVCALVVLALLIVGCEDNGDSDSSSSSLPSGDDDSGDVPDVGMIKPELDDCGFPVVDIPDGCTNCHGMPPATARHPKNKRCFRCHGYTIDANMQFVQAELHNNGKVEYAVGCSSCHGWDQGMSPPQNLAGECGDTKQGVGSHAAMRRAPIIAHRTACNNCHVVPIDTWDAAHIDGDHKAEVHFANLAVVNGANANWDGTKCSNIYCHGATLEGGTHKEPTWGDTSGDAGKCGACHRLTDPDGNADADCQSCHVTSVAADRSILESGDHINGTIDLEYTKKGGGK